MTRGQRVKVIREQLGLTQRDLAASAGTSHGFISALENSDDSVNHGVEVLRGIATALGVPLVYLIDGQPVPKRPGKSVRSRKGAA